MPFIAINKETKERIDITKLSQPRRDLSASEIVCQLCGSPMIVKAGLVMRHHFAHKAKCVSDYGSHPESLEHRAGKQFLADNLPHIYGDFLRIEPLIEYPIAEVRRIADVMLCFPNGWRVAHEVQLASIATEELDARTQDYLLAGVDLFWWFGKSADTPANRAWAQRRFGCVGRIEFEGKTEGMRILAEGGVTLGLMPGKLRIDISETAWGQAGSRLIWGFWGLCSRHDGRVYPDPGGLNGIQWAARRFFNLAFFRAHEIAAMLSWSEFIAVTGYLRSDTVADFYNKNISSYFSFLNRYIVGEIEYWHLNRSLDLCQLATLSLRRQALPCGAIVSELILLISGPFFPQRD